MSFLTSVNVGLPRDIQWQGRTVRTAVWKSPVPGRVFVRRLNIDGDGQGDRDGHGGEQRAVMVYQLESYHYWEEYLGRPGMEPGSFGENFTVTGLADADVCIGDQYRIGGALFEVSQPRVTCYRVGIRLEHAQLPSLLVAHRRPGFYFRVIEEGFVAAGDPIVKVADGPEQMTVADIDTLLYSSDHPIENLERALRIPMLSVGWQSSFKSLLEMKSKTGLSGNAGLVPPEPKAAWTGFRPLRVVTMSQESDDIRSFTLEAIDRSALPTYLPGQHLVFRLPATGSASIVSRIYSLCGAPDAGVYRIAVKNEGGPGSSYFHKRVEIGNILESSAPRGTFTLDQSDSPLVLLSGGVGITPVLAMLYAAVASQSRLRRELWWIHSTRNGESEVFGVEVKALLAGLKEVHSRIVFSRPGPSDRAGVDYDQQGHVNASWLREIGVPPSADFYLCGPPTFLADLRSGLDGWGVSKSRVHVELFGAAPSLAPGVVSDADGAPHQPAGPRGSGPSVTFVRSGVTTPWAERYSSLLELAEACSVPVRWSCRSGVCHTCETGLIDGDVNYDPQPLEEAADGSTLICCARPISDVQLDL
ncbi:MOSC domain-containing protein [Starkeya sp. ORNL1]|uniref:MOSC and FAD-binding oxidoreductase domain-containing protein n=1 Tax=Starkeya sp. ORNL1 TaxID=2709380 RepID=UPI0014643E63|nr:MOSC and FAD-binding oxidoreductase domain-containing protein [Starkeya sp. ORNL1]QJP14792.1 MOSC domain-containing protein [Starkeya sp. ORNL1]